MRRFFVLMAISVFLASCFSPKRDAEYSPNKPIPTEGREGVELVITEERFSEPAVPSEEKNGVLQPVQDWNSSEMREYRIGPGDVIRVILLVSLDASAYEVMVASNGTVVLPLIGPFPVAGETVLNAQKAINIAFSEYYVNPHVQLRVTAYNSQRIYIMGGVGMKTFPIQKRTSLFEVVNALDQNINEIDLKGVYLLRDGKIYPLHIDDLAKGDLNSNYELQNNDIIYLPRMSTRKVYILGYVQKQGMFTMEKDENLFTLLAKAGGYSTGAQLREVRIIRGGLADPVLLTVNINPLFKRRPSRQLTAQDLTVLAISVEATRKSTISLEKLYLQDGDIIYVPPTALQKWNEIMAQISPTITYGLTRPMLVARDLIFLKGILVGE